MTKIKRLSQLQKERRRLALRRSELEQIIRTEWQDIRRSLAPATLARQAVGNGIQWIREHWLNKKR